MGHLFADDVLAVLRGSPSAQLIFAGRIQALSPITCTYRCFQIDSVNSLKLS